MSGTDGTRIQVQAVDFGQAITPGTGKTTLAAADAVVALTIENTDGADKHAVVVQMDPDTATKLIRDIEDAVAVARHRQFMARFRRKWS